MGVHRKTDKLSNGTNDEQHVGHVHNSGHDSIELLEVRQRPMPLLDECDLDSKFSLEQDDPRGNSDSSVGHPLNNRYQRIGQLPEGFLSISALVHEGNEDISPNMTILENNRQLHTSPAAIPALSAFHHRRAEPNVDAFQNPLKQQLFLLMEQPSSSSAALWINVTISMLIVLSALMTTIETIPTFRSSESNRVWFNLETAMVSLFTMEFLLRMFAHSDSLHVMRFFFTSPLTIIDFIAIAPFYVELIAKRDTTYEFRFTILRLLRLLRLFKTFKYSNTVILTMEVMMVALRRSGEALSALFFFLVTSIVLFSTLLYFAERGVWDESLQAFVDPNGKLSSFDSIPAAFWFVLVTITTTGYGDMVPATLIGKAVTFPAMMFGVLLIALPSIIIGRHFTIVWEAMQRRQYYNEMLAANNEFIAHDANVEHGESLNECRHDRAAAPVLVNSCSGRRGAGYPMSPREQHAHRHAFDILGDNRDGEIMDQLQTLLGMARQNQEAIQHIVAVLETQFKQYQPTHSVMSQRLSQETCHSRVSFHSATNGLASSGQSLSSTS